MTPWKCVFRRPRSDHGLGFTNCHCARFDDGSCVPTEIYAEFARRRDQEAEAMTRKFADVSNYE